MKLPILLLANYRTGSSAHVGVLALQYGIEKFPEPHLYPHKLAELEDRIQRNRTSFIVKCMPDYIDSVAAYKTLYESNCYKIKLTRRDKVAQITSYYLSLISGIWNSSNPSARGQRYSVPIQDDVIAQSTDYILYNEKLLNSSTVHFDEEVVYEDLDLSTSPWAQKLSAPTNYDQLYSYIEKYYNSKMS